MSAYTVVGLWIDDDPPCRVALWADEESPEAAIAWAEKQGEEIGSNLLVAGVFTGHLYAVDEQ